VYIRHLTYQRKHSKDSFKEGGLQRNPGKDGKMVYGMMLLYLPEFSSTGS
jgi:hypothetical protein